MNNLLGFSHILGALAAAALLTAPPALAQDEKKDEKKDATEDVGLGLAPGSPQVGTLPGGVTVMKRDLVVELVT